MWTVENLATFLTTIVSDLLFALWCLIALRPTLRLRWTELELNRGLLFILRNRTIAGYQVTEVAPKTSAGVRAVALDKHTVKLLREHRRRQIQQRTPASRRAQAWHDSE